MGHTIFIRDLVTPKFYTVQVPDNEDDPHGPTHPEQRQTPVPSPVYPASFTKRVWFAKQLDYYGETGDWRKRAELWEDSAGAATWPEIIGAFPDLPEYFCYGIRKHFNQVLQQIATPYMMAERETWHVQQREAEAWSADQSAQVPLIAAMAQARSLPLADLAGKILENVVLFRQTAGLILGRQQAMLDRVWGAESLEELQAVSSELGFDVLNV